MTAPAPRVVPQSWRVGLNTASEEERVADGDGPYEVRMTFADTPDGKQAAKDWMLWLMDMDPAWGGTP